MKALLNICSISLLLGSFAAKANGGLIQASVMTTAVPTAVLCSALGQSSEIPEAVTCMISASASTTVGISIALLKEMQEVQPEALSYLSGEEASPALISVTLKVQEILLENGEERSFEEIASSIASL